MKRPLSEHKSGKGLLPEKDPAHALYYPGARQGITIWRAVWPFITAAALCLVLALLLPTISAFFPVETELFYSNGLFPAVSALWTLLAGFVPFSMAEMLVYALVVTGVVLVVWGIVLCFKRKWKTVLLGTLTLCLIASALFVRFYVAWGFNYFRIPASSRMGLNVARRNPQELADLCVSLAVQASQMRDQLPSYIDGSVNLGTVHEMFDAIPPAFAALREKYPFLNRMVAKPKQVLASEAMCYAGISGIFIPFTFECNVNTYQPSLLLPVTAAHEAVHQTGIAREDEANFIGYLACMETDNLNLRYSATMLALINSANALNSISPQAYTELHKQFYSEAVIRDLDHYRQFWAKYEGPVQESVTRSNDKYLKSNGQSDGVLSYGRMVDLLLAAREAGLIQ